MLRRLASKAHGCCLSSSAVRSLPPAPFVGTVCIKPLNRVDRRCDSQMTQIRPNTKVVTGAKKMETNVDFIGQARDFLSFVNVSPTPFHATQSARIMFENAGFQEIKERDSWASICKPGGKYFLTRNGSSIVAFAIGKKWKPGNSIAIVGAHTDSPCLRIKPVSKKSGDGFVQVGVEAYGGGIWHSWFDRDLAIAGRAMVYEPDGSIRARLVRIDRPILRIPTLAIHLERTQTFDFNKETQLFPIAGLVEAELERTGKAAQEAKKEQEAEDDSTPFSPLKGPTERHHPYIVELIATDLAVKPTDIVDFEMLLYDTQPACLGGLLEEFIFSARLDNLNSSYCATAGLINSVNQADALEDEPSIRCAALFDHEEIGSQTAQGADSNMMPAILKRLASLPASHFASGEEISTATAFEQSLSTSFLLSADMAHSVNPNYASKYESDHKPLLNKGPVIKINANARYATNSPGIVLLQETARVAVLPVPLQLFVVRNDSSCGSTIGPMLSAKMGMRTLDLGNPQLSMHSIRETGGTKDVAYAISLFQSFFTNFSTLQPRILVD
ncbi:hypothetical protein KEM54_002511 [Ascosphaera aggregata]|nr:hypothetical protein KEM54_002511 [Ascosphaera aggregata]